MVYCISLKVCSEFAHLPAPIGKLRFRMPRFKFRQNTLGVASEEESPNVIARTGACDFCHRLSAQPQLCSGTVGCSFSLNFAS